MTITIKTTKFIEAARLVGLVIKKKNTIPILDAMLLETHGDKIRLVGTDLDMEIEAWVPCVISAGSKDACIVGHDGICKALRVAGGETLEITSEKELNDVREHGFSRFISGDMELFDDGLPAMDFPYPATMADKPSFRTEVGDDFITALLQVRRAMSEEETRYYLKGIYIHQEKGWRYNMVATDGHRLFKREIVWPHAEGNINDGPEGIIIPKKAVNILANILQRVTGPITMTYGASVRKNKDDTLADHPQTLRLRFAMKIGDMSVMLTTKPIDGTFPDYRRVMPDHDPTKPAATMKINDFRKAVEAMRNGAHYNKSRPIEMTINDDRMEIRSNWIVSKKNARINIPCQSFGKLKVGYNSKYLMNVIQSMPKAENITFKWQDGLSPTIIVSPECPEFQAILMPMRI